VTARNEFFNTFGSNILHYGCKGSGTLDAHCGSMDAERMVKPDKHTIMTKHRNRLKDPKGVALFRLSENLKHIMKAKKMLGKKITESI
jgi:hypothetical protein